MKKTKQFRPTAFIVNAKMKVSLMLLLMLMLVPQGVWAIGGSGTSSDPFTIANASDLKEFADIVNGTNGKTRNVAACGKLTADINLGNAAWKAMGSSSYAYTGTFDGQGHTISGFSMEGYTKVNAGFFGYVNGATIKNFTLNGSMSSSTQITSGENDCSGAVVGRAMGSSTIQDIVSNVNITLTKAQKHLGGVVGAIEGSTVVKGCTYTGTLNAGPSTDCIGGIVGFAPASCSGSIFYCFFNGTLSSSSSTPTMGGILGYTNDESNNFSGVHDCYSCGTFSFGASDYKYVNAIVGRIRNRATTTINNTYLSGKATRACNTDGPSIPASNKAITISVTAGANGTVSQTYVNPTSTAATKLHVEATPNTGYHFTKWSDNNTSANRNDVALTANVNLTATFAAHTYGNWITDRAATCTASGTKHHVCTFAGCDARENGTIPATGHGQTNGYTPTYTWSNDINAHTCSFTLKCKDCNTNVVSNKQLTGTQTAHTDATCITAGYTTYRVTGSYNVSGSKQYSENNSKTYTIAALNHSYTSEDESDTYLAAAATCTEDTRYYYKCSRCAEKGTTTWAKTGTALGHDINDNQCSRCDSKAKAVYADGTLTFYFDDVDHPGTTYAMLTEDEDFKGYPGWYCGIWEPGYIMSSITSVVFDESFAYARPTTCQGWFYDCSKLQSITGLQYLNTASVTSMESMFYGCSGLESLNLNSFNTANVTDMSGMFEKCSGLKSLDLSSFNTANVTNMEYMFSRCSGLKSLNLSSFNTSKVERTRSMFANCSSLQSLDLSNFNTANVTNMSGMFAYCSSLQSLDLSNFNTANVTNMSSMFTDCSSLQSLDLSNFNTANVQEMITMFYNCSGLKSLDLSSFNTTNSMITTGMYEMFNGCSMLESLTIANFNMTWKGDFGVSFVSAERLFEGCSALNTLTLKSIPCLNDGTFNTQFSGAGKTVNYELDDNSFINTEFTNYLPAPATSTATFNREIVADGGMYSFIVPFDIPAGQAAELGKFYQYTSHDPEVRKVYFDDIAEVSDGVVKANTAYFFKPARDITSFTVENPTFGTSGNMPDAENPSVPGLYGTYSQIQIPVGAYGYVVQDGQSTFVRAGYSNILWPFRAYLWLGSGASMARAHAIRGQQKGDVNGDGKISLADLTLLVEILNGNVTDSMGTADIDGKNGVTIDDLEILRNHILGLLNIEDLYPEYDGQTPTGFCINYDDEEQVPTISESIWDR